MKPVRILVVDAQGGGIGRQLVEKIKELFPDAVITAVGTNSIATAAMHKAKADYAATGENAVAVACRSADIILGPIGIVIADSLWGEITPRIALSVAQSQAKRILIPFNHCDNIVAGCSGMGTGRLLQAAMEELKRQMELSDAACREE